MFATRNICPDAQQISKLDTSHLFPGPKQGYGRSALPLLQACVTTASMTAKLPSDNRFVRILHSWCVHRCRAESGSPNRRKELENTDGAKDTLASITELGASIEY